MEVWNKRDIPGPPEYTVEYTPSDRGKLDHCIQKLLKCVNDGHTVLCDGEVSDSFKREVAVLAASLYQNGRHRTEKFYKVLKKAQKCCEQWKELNLGSVFNKLLHLMPLIPPPPHRNVRIPSKQMFEYLCLRLMGGWHLLWQLEGYCREAATYLMAKISSGHFFCTAMAFLANTGRLRALALDMCGQLSMLYEDVLSVLHHLQSSDTPGVVPGAYLPPSLSNTQSSRTANACFCILQDKDTEKCTKSSSNIAREDEGAKDEKSIYSNTCIIEAGSKDDRPQAPAMQQDEDLGICVEGEQHCLTPDCNTKKHKKMKTGILKQIAASQGKLRAEKKRNPSTSNNNNNNTIKVKLKSDRPQTSVMLQDEDIGIRVEEEQHLVNTGCNTKKQKAIKKGKMRRKVQHKVLVCNKVPNPHSYISDVYEKPEKKKKRVLKFSHKDSITKELGKLYKQVKQNVNKINSPEDLEEFLKEEQNRRCNKSVDIVSSHLKTKDWTMFKKFMKKQLKCISKLKEQNLSLSGNTKASELLSKTKIRFKFWLLYPELEGKKPENWATVLKDLKSYK